MAIPETTKALPHQPVTRKVIAAPSSRQRLLMRSLILMGLVSLGVFLYWFWDKDFIGYAPLYWALAIAFGYKILRLLHEWYHYFSIRVNPQPEATRDWTVDMVTTFCAGEPYDMILDTLQAMVEVTYPHTTYLCDEANDPFLRQKCEEMGVVHVYRGTDKQNAKAGNVNYTLRNHATGEIVVILDPDHKPVPEFLDRVLPYFEQDEIGYVQCVQAYKNQNESFVAKGAAQQTYHFYGPMMMSMNSYGTVQAIGANCTFRRAALDSIGGHAPGLSEDMHTAMRLHAAGWKSVYVPENLTRGLVPSTLGAYYKQQLKWSRGSFDLLFRVLPGLMPNLSWRQILHYLTIPLYFLSGLIALIDILVPILALTFARSPWYVELNELFQVTLPLLALMVLIRQYAQKWTLEEHETGFHFIGGALLFGSWWINLTGFIYAIFKVKVPYIPTPKDDEPTNAWKLSIPNFSVIGLSIAAIIYGLSIDWSPYSFIMAGFAGVNIFLLTFVTLMSQQKLFLGLYRKLYANGETALSRIRKGLYVLRHRWMYRTFRNSYVLGIVLLGTLLISASLIDRSLETDMGKGLVDKTKVHDIFYLGVQLEDLTASPTQVVQKWEKDLQAPASMVALPVITEISPRVQAQITALSQQGYTPLLNWRPDYQADSLIRASATKLAELPGTVMIRLHTSPLSDTTANPIQEWRHLVNIFRSQGVPNVVWVWQSAGIGQKALSYPGANWVDVVGLNLDNKEPFKASYEAYRQEGYPHPVLLTGFETEATDWTREAFEAMQSEYEEIQGIVLNANEEQLALSSYVQDLSQYVRQLDQRSFSTLGLNQFFSPETRTDGLAQNASPIIVKAAETTSQAKEWLGKADGGGYEWLKNGEPFALKGVVYNPAQDWRDGNTPLTRNKLMQDFQHIRKMGANTISRYRPSIYDENLLRAAEDTRVNILYGFWFDPWVDYYADTAKVNAYVSETLAKVKEFKQREIILGWGLGGDTWQRLAYHFHPTYVFRVRQGYLLMLEKIAQEIHAQDPQRPVYTRLAFDDQLPAKLSMISAYAPSIDMPGLEVFHQEEMAKMDSLMDTQWTDKPWFVAEFGPQGFWTPAYMPLDRQGFLDEPADYLKGSQMKEAWTEFIEQGSENKLGGLAFCWQERFEGTETWYGLSDREGRLKPAYFALKQVFTDSEALPSLSEVYIRTPLDIPDKRKFLNFRATSPNNQLEGVEQEWWVVKEHTNEEVGSIRLKKKYSLAFVDLPLPPGGYRIYLRLTDQNGQSVTASRGFTVWPYNNP